MPPRTDDPLLESIVAGVLARLRGTTAPTTDQASRGRQPAGHVPASPNPDPLTLTDPVITAAVLESKLNGSRSIRFAPKAVLTPTAHDYLRIHAVDWAYATRPANDRKSPGVNTWAALIVCSTPAVDRVVTDLLPGTRTELLACPDDAAELAIAEITRGGFSKALIFAEQTHRAACLANRHEAVKAVAVRDATDVLAIKKQLRPNVWCLDPTGRSHFELRNIVKAITTG